MDERKRDELLSKQDFVLRTDRGQADSATTFRRMSRMEVFNALEWIEAAINNAEDERMVCSWKRPPAATGTTGVQDRRADAAKNKRARARAP